MHDILDVIIRIMADYLVVPIVLIGGWAMLRLPARERVEKFGFAIMAGLVALFIAKLMSLLYQDGQRPFLEMGVEAKAAYLNNPGFPSDHVLFVFAITLVVWASTKNKKLALTLVALSVLVAAGRVLALVHTPLDVTGGIVAALLGATLVYGRQLYRGQLPR